MRKICLFNYDSDSKLSYNLFAKLARESKRVLIVDLRLNKKSENSIGLDIYSCINEDKDPSKYIISLEPNLDIIKGNSSLNLQEFNIFYELFKMDYFERLFKNLNQYDYIVFEVSPQLNLITTNALFNSTEIMSIIDLDNSGLDFLHKLSRFAYHYNKFYGKEIFISRVFPTYKNKLNKENYTHLVSEFTSKLSAFPLNSNKKDKEFSDALTKNSISIIDDEKIFNSHLSIKERQKHIKEYLDIITENSTPETPLTKF